MTEASPINQLIDHLFRHESGKMVAVLTRIFGPTNMELAEDVVQDSLVEAIKHWTYKGIPSNPSGWLFRVAKNKALNIINRNKYKTQYSADVAPLLQSVWTIEPAVDHLFSEQEILDDQLRMMFTCCHPSITADSQVALILKTLCGFSIHEIARAFFTTDENINKRLVRARQKIKESELLFEVPAGKALLKRLQTVLEAIYLLFNEGYSASAGSSVIRYEVCGEAIRLAEIITRHPAITDTSDVYALLALMQLNASRFKARTDEHGNIVTLQQQDRSSWDFSLMKNGFINLEKSVTSGGVSMYHILASISSYHCCAVDYQSTDWQSILVLYDKLLLLDGSPVVHLNRAVALAKVAGVEEAVTVLKGLQNTTAIASYYLFHSIQAEFYMELGRPHEAAEMFEIAIKLAPLAAEKALLKSRLEACKKIF